MDSTQISDRDQEADYLYAMRLASGSVLPMVLKSAIELDVLEIIARAGPGGSMSPNEIASHLPTSNPDAPLMLDRMLRLLASYSILTCSLRSLPDGKVERLYGLAPVCKYFTKNEDGVSLSAFSLLGQDKVVMESWYCFKDAVLEGGVPFEKTHGMACFECLSINPTFNKIFNNAMASISTITLKKILETYKGFEGLKSVIDVGGGTGAALNMIISIYPTIRGINFDLPHVIKDAPSYPGVTHVEGDLFVSIPKGGDAIFLKWICHDWSDEHCLKLLKNCHEALPDDGKMFVCEWIHPAALDPSLKSNVVLHFDCIMMSSFKDGKERTEDEFKALAKEAGFQGFQLVRCAPAIYIMEFLKKT